MEPAGILRYKAVDDNDFYPQLCRVLLLVEKFGPLGTFIITLITKPESYSHITFTNGRTNVRTVID